MPGPLKRPLWRPKLKELPEQCASCPFRKDNDKEFGAIIDRLRRSAGQHGRMTRGHVQFARLGLYADALERGDFLCHHTVYDEKMNYKPEHERRQCPGATKLYRGE